MVPCAVVRGAGTGRELAHGRAENRPDGIRLTEFHSAGGDLGVEFLDNDRPVGRCLVFHCMGVIVPCGLFYLCIRSLLFGERTITAKRRRTMHEGKRRPFEPGVA